MNIFARIEKRIKDAVMEQATALIIKLVNDTVESKLFQDPQLVSVTINKSTAVALDGKTVEYRVYNIDATKSRNAEIYTSSHNASIKVNAKKNTSGVLYIHYNETPGRLTFDPQTNLFNKGFDLSYEPGKIDMLFWTKKGNNLYWRRAKSF
jgi:hypothetical protein